MKKFILALVFFLTAGFFPFGETSSVVASNAPFETPVCMTVNGIYIKADTPAFLEKGYTMVPIRTISDALSCDTIHWNEKTRTAVIQKDSTSISIAADSKTALVNEKKVSLDASAKLRADRLYVPIRFVAETFGTQVRWDNESYTVHITAKNVSVPTFLHGERGYSDEDLYWLSRIVHAESQGESMSGKIGVANVVLNRVRSDDFADTVQEVIFDRNYGVQFTPTANGTIYQTPLGDSIVAAKRAFLGENTIGESLYFLNPRISTSFWIVNNRTFYKRIGRHDFYL